MDTVVFEGRQLGVVEAKSLESGAVSDVNWGCQAVRTGFRGGEVLDESEDLKGHWAPFIPRSAPRARSGVSL